MKVVLDLNKERAVPINNIAWFEINTIDAWTEKNKKEWGGGRYYVMIYGVQVMMIYTADTKEKCIKFIEEIGVDNH